MQRASPSPVCGRDAAMRFCTASRSRAEQAHELVDVTETAARPLLISVALALACRLKHAGPRKWNPGHLQCQIEKDFRIPGEDLTDLQIFSGEAQF